jgi:REP element-mobilizing transposase RayT
MKVDSNYQGHRNSYTDLNTIYFWTTTINHWHQLLKADVNKMIIVNSLQWLIAHQLIVVYGYVIMPNHVHLLWEQLKMNGKELPKNSFEKFTAKSLIHKMQRDADFSLNQYAVNAGDRQLNIWQRDPLAIRVFNRDMAAQKLNYIHNNPLQPHWNLCNEPEQYAFSSAKFYEMGMDKFNLVTHYWDAF